MKNKAISLILLSVTSLAFTFFLISCDGENETEIEYVTKEIPLVMTTENATAVYHWKQNLSRTSYTIYTYQDDGYNYVDNDTEQSGTQYVYEIESKTVASGTKLAEIAKTITGFTAKGLTTTIGNDGEVVANVYYDRDYITLTISVNGKEYKTSGLFGATTTMPNTGKNYVLALSPEFPTLFPAKNTTYTAMNFVTSNEILPEMKTIAGGTFKRARAAADLKDESKIYTITVSDFLIASTETTQKLYSAVMGVNPSHFNGTSGTDKNGEEYDYSPAEGETQELRPVEYVNWYSAIKFCNLLSLHEGFTPVYTINGSTNPEDWGNVPTTDSAIWNAATMDTSANGYRLPTEAEWQYAALGNYASSFSGYDKAVFAGYTGTESISDYAWISENSEDKTHEVAKKNANSYGLYDMSGNLFEWCWDWYGELRSASNPTGALKGTDKVRAGGAFYSTREASIAISNFKSVPSLRSSAIGIRVVRSIIE